MLSLLKQSIYAGCIENDGYYRSPVRSFLSMLINDDMHFFLKAGKAIYRPNGSIV